MNCKETTQMMFDYLEGKLTKEQHSDISNHLNHCLSCSKIFNDAQQTVNMFSLIQASTPEPSPFFTEKTLALMKQSKQQSPSSLSWAIQVLFSKWPTVAASVASIFAGVLMSILFYNNIYNAPVVQETDTVEPQSIEEIYVAQMSDTYMNTYYNETNNIE